MTDNYFCCFCFAWALLQFSKNETAYGLDNRNSQRSGKFDSGSHELQKSLAVAFPVKVKVNMWNNVKIRSEQLNKYRWIYRSVIIYRRLRTV